MAGKKGDESPKRDPLADEIDALLKKLPHAGDEPAAPQVPGPRPAPMPTPKIQVGRPRAPTKTGRVPLAVWGQVAGGAVLAGALTQWPYASVCGWGLLAYCSAVAALLIVGGWCAMEAWRARLGAAHVLSLIMVFWGIALAAEVVLPRIGYARESATWRCVAEVPTARPTAPPLTPVVPADEAGAVDDGLAAVSEPADTTAAGAPDAAPADSAAAEALAPDSTEG